MHKTIMADKKIDINKIFIYRELLDAIVPTLILLFLFLVSFLIGIVLFFNYKELIFNNPMPILYTLFIPGMSCIIVMSFSFDTFMKNKWLLYLINNDMKKAIEIKHSFMKETFIKEEDCDLIKVVILLEANLLNREEVSKKVKGFLSRGEITFSEFLVLVDYQEVLLVEDSAINDKKNLLLRSNYVSNRNLLRLCDSGLITNEEFTIKSLQQKNDFIKLILKHVLHTFKIMISTFAKIKSRTR